jgi:hypothetical protein
MRARARVVLLAGPIAAACFDDPPKVAGDEGTSTSTSTSGPASAGGSTSTGPGGSAEVSSSATADPDSSSSGDVAGFDCDQPTVVEYERLTGASGITFGAVGPIGDERWVFGTFTPDASTSAAAWPIEGDAIGMRVLATPNPVELSAFVPGVQPLAIYHRLGTDAVLLDNPAVQDWAVIGTWDIGNDNGFNDVVRDQGEVLWGAGFDTDAGGRRFWQVAHSESDGEAWMSDMLTYTMASGHPASANAIAVGPMATLVVAGEAEDTDGKLRWVTFVYPAGTSPSAPADASREGSARAAVILDNDALVGGATPGGGAIRWAPLGEPAFEDAAAFDRPIVDLELAPGVVLALGSFDTGSGGWSLWACTDPVPAQECWTPIVEGRDVSGMGHAHARSMFVDGENVWVAATIDDVGDGSPGGQLYRVECG